MMPKLIFILVLLSTLACLGQEIQISPSAPPTENSQHNPGLDVEYLTYEDRVYSQSRKTALGEQVELDAAFRYRFTPDTFSRFRFEIDPQEDTLEGKTSKLEFLLNHRSGAFVGQLDLDLKGSDGETGGLSIGPDNDSEGTYLSYQASSSTRFNFFPYNFDGEVGEEFNTWDVTRIYYITDSPSTLTNVQVDDERIEARTIPGFGLDYSFGSFLLSTAFGVATYLYPSAGNFDIENNPTTTQWERREDRGWRLSLAYQSEGLAGELEHVAHDRAGETGSLLAAATALRLAAEVSPFILETEIVRSTAGKNAYELNKEGTWFQSDRYEPIYSDFYGNRQDWLGKSDTAAMIKAGLRRDTLTPYLSYKWQGEHFVYRELESAHLLRTSDDRRSHGGLQRIGLGAHIFTGGLEIQPQIEWMKSQNKVFGSSTDIRQDRINRDLKTTDILFTIAVKYAFDDTAEAR